MTAPPPPPLHAMRQSMATLRAPSAIASTKGCHLFSL
jgi:hypothetical protein